MYCHLDLWLGIIVDNAPAREALLEDLIFELWLMGKKEERFPYDAVR